MIKITNVIQQADKLVAKGKWVFVETIPKHEIVLVGIKSTKPIIVSETEKIELDDWYIDDANQIRKSVTDDEDYWEARKDYNKILALTGELHSETLQLIVDGKIKDQDEVFVQCERKSIGYSKDHGGNIAIGANFIKLTNGFVNVLPDSFQQRFDYLMDEHDKLLPTTPAYTYSNSEGVFGEDEGEEDDLIGAVMDYRKRHGYYDEKPKQSVDVEELAREFLTTFYGIGDNRAYESDHVTIYEEAFNKAKRIYGIKD